LASPDTTIGPTWTIAKPSSNTLSGMVGPTKVMVSGDTLQVNDYSKYNWTMFDPEAKKIRHDTVFPQEMEKAFLLGAEMVKNPWG